MDGPPAAWEILRASDPNAGPAHDPALWRALAGTLPGFEGTFVAVEEEGRLIGGAPAILERRAGLHWLHVLPFLLPGAPLAIAGRHADVDRAVAAAFESRARSLGAVGGEWVLYRPRGPEIEPEALARMTGETRVFEAALVDLAAGIEPAWRRVERRTRQEIQAARRRLTSVEGPEALEAAFALHQAQARRWPAHRPLPIELARRLLAGEAPAARLFGVRDRQGLLAAALVLISPREAFPWWSGSHPEGRLQHAFPLLLWSVVEWAAARGLDRLNLGGSAGLAPVASFKRALGAAAYRYPVRWLDARHAGRLGRLAARLQSALRRGRPIGERA